MSSEVMSHEFLSSPYGDGADAGTFFDVQRQHREFAYYLGQFGVGILLDDYWQERANVSGVALSRCLILRHSYLGRITRALVEARTGNSVTARPALYDQDDSIGQTTFDYRRMLNRCIEDWGVYVDGRSELFISYIQGYANHNFDEFDGEIGVEQAVDIIVDRRQQVQWARFEPMDYEQTKADIKEFCDLCSWMSWAEIRRRGLNRPAHRANHRCGNRRLRRADQQKFDQLVEYCEGASNNQPAEVDSDYLRDLIRLRSLFLVDDDPTEDWNPKLLAVVA